VVNAGHILLIDASGFAYRSFYSRNPVYRASDGLPIGATLGFMEMVWGLLGRAQADQPTHAAAIFDAPGSTFRHTLFPEYKANRKLMKARQQELTPQLPYMRHAAEAMGLVALDAPGWEADDVIATLETRAGEAGVRTTIVSSDKDFQQLVKDGEVEIVDPVARKRILESDVRDSRKFGVAPYQVPDVQALAGDPVDNIPGLDGIGLKTAAGLIRQFGSIGGLTRAAGQRGVYLTGTVRAQLKRNGHLLPLYKKLATLDREVPLDISMDALRSGPAEREHLLKFLKVLEAESRFDSIFGGETKLERAVPFDVEPFGWWAEELLAPGQRVPEAPQCGYYRRQLKKGAAFVPARIWRTPEFDFVTEKPTGKEIVHCEVGGDLRDAFAEWPRLSANPITKFDFEFETADMKWAREHAPNHPKANPRKLVDITALPASRCPQPVSKRRKQA
jgi:5'-3' exonuclease